MYLIIIVILIIFFIFFNYFYNKGSYQKIVGDRFDKNAKSAFQNIKTPQKKYEAAQVVRFVLGDEELADNLIMEAIIQIEQMPNPVFFQDNMDYETILFVAGVEGVEIQHPDFFHRPIQNDPQNVHDSLVVNGTAKRWREMLEDEKTFMQKQSIENIQFKNPEANKVLEKIIREPAFITTLNTSDYDVLQKTWNYIDGRPELIESLENSLANCVDDDYIVCTTGRVSQILDCFTLMDKKLGTPILTVELERKKALDEALEIIKNLNEEEKKIYEGDDCPEREKLIEKMKNSLPEGKFYDEARMGF